MKIFNKKYINKILLAATIVFVCYTCVRILIGISFLINTWREFNQSQARLLSQTNYQSLADACQELSTRVLNNELETGKYEIRDAVDKDALNFPEPIMNLNPEYVNIHKEGSVFIMVELRGAFAHFGIVFYPDELLGPGDRDDDYFIKLCDGLFYFDVNYQKENVKYRRKVDSLIEKGKAKQMEK